MLRGEFRAPWEACLKYMSFHQNLAFHFRESGAIATESGPETTVLP